MEIYLIISQILATYVITAVFLYSDGAYGILGRLRSNDKVMRFGLLECFLCLSFWVALLLILVGGGTWQSFFIVWGSAFIIDQLIMAYKTR